MQERQLGNSSISVPSIGLGTIKLGRLAGLKYPATQVPTALPDDEHVLQLLREAAKLGVSLIDTAPAYGQSEQRLGELLYRVQPRERWVLCSKVGEEFAATGNERGEGTSTYDFSDKAIVASIDRSLQRLRTDYLDIALLHFSSAVDDEVILQKAEAYDTLAMLKAQGKIRAIGASTSSLAGGIIAVQRCEVAMLTLSPTERRDLTAIIEARTSGCGVLIKKALGSGHVAAGPAPTPSPAQSPSHPVASDPVQTALRAVLAEPSVTSVIIGTSNPKHLTQAVLIAESVRCNAAN
jgi:aryl-alcohol dehydrogenase-like predicted oxidoreductase